MPRGFETARLAVKPEPRGEGKPPARLMALEAARLAERLPRGAIVVALDERGRDLDTQAFARRLRGWLDDAAPLAFVVGGPDGLDADFKRRAALQLRLSAFTLPHALAQLMLCEQLYRAATVLTGHPYHRE